VALLDYNLGWAEETKHMIDSEGGTSEVIQVDVTNEEACKQAVSKTVQLFGAVHILVNIGGSISPPSSQQQLIMDGSGRRWCHG